MIKNDLGFGPATRGQGLRILEAFQPRMGAVYAKGRNYDRGAGRHDDVSRLSPFVRRRLVTEWEAVAAALSMHGLDQAEKFIQEILWRAYFKGWFEQRPQIWAEYVAGLDSDLAAISRDPALSARIKAAEDGRTGLECFDAWSEELKRTGYLHNHARMWFASIWVFTFGLPWRVGADFFYRHLLDGDPASNTCSWRWVAGLHTRGKPYEARALNIAQFTGQRFVPNENELASHVTGLQDQEPQGLPEVQGLRDVKAPDLQVPTAILLTEDDCSIEQYDLSALDTRAVAGFHVSGMRSPRSVSPSVAAFETAALTNTAERARLDANVIQEWTSAALADWVEAKGARQIAMPYVPVGPLGDWMARARPVLQARGIAVTEWKRDWDAIVWPHATAGFFKVKKRLPEILRTAGLI